MDQHRFRRKERMKAGFVEAQAQVDVVEIDRETLRIKAANRTELRGVHHQAGRGDGRDPVRGAKCGEVPRSIAREMPVCVGHEATRPEHDSPVLDPARPVDKLRANGSDVRPQGVAGHGDEPIRPEGFDVVVEEHEQPATGPGRRGVVHGREVEGPWVRHHEPPPLPREGLQVRKGLRIPAAVVTDDEFQRGPCRPGAQRIEAGTQQVEPVAGRDDDADEGRLRQGMGYPDQAPGFGHHR